jgi:hypothetical protein
VSGAGPDPGDRFSPTFTLTQGSNYQIQWTAVFPAGTYNFMAVCTAPGGSPTVASAAVSVTWQ